MIHEMSNAVQGALRQEKKFELITNHLANVKTTGFKAQTLSFDELFQAHMKTDFSQGTLLPTGNPFNVGINGEGFFKVQTDEGIRYTRNGSFSLNKDGVLMTSAGHPVLGQNGPITIDGTEIEIMENGEISVDGSQAGQISVVNFTHPEKLSKQGGSLFTYTGSPKDEKPQEDAFLRQGSIEQSNVESVREMTKMVETSRYYESFQKLIQTIDEMDAKAINEVGQVR